MLIPAILKKEELERLFAEHIYDDNMFFYNGYSYCNTIPDFTPKENWYKWAIVDGDTLLGYFAYYIDTFSDTVCRFGLYSFKRSTIIGADVYRKMKELISRHHKVEWRMIAGNPVERHYDKFCTRYNGYKTILHDVTKGLDGNYVNEYIYEIINNG